MYSYSKSPSIVGTLLVCVLRADTRASCALTHPTCLALPLTPMHPGVGDDQRLFHFTSCSSSNLMLFWPLNEQINRMGQDRQDAFQALFDRFGTAGQVDD